MTHILSDTDLVILRQFPQSLTRYLSVCPRTPVFQAQVDSYVADSVTDGVISITFKNITLGRYQNVLLGLTIDIGSTPGGREYGSMRVRKATTTTTIYCAETARGECLVAPNTYITAREERRLWAKLALVTKSKSVATMNFDDTFAYAKDYDLAYTDENRYHRPLACITGKPAGWVDNGQAYRTVTLDSSDSAGLADGATISSRAWDLGDGALVSGYALSDTMIQATFPPGFRYVSVTVTDSNSKTATRYFPVWAHDAAHPPVTAFEVTRDETEAGREMDFVLVGEHGEFSESIIPEGSLICYWEEAWFGDDLAPDQYRSQYLGWSTGDLTQIKLGEGKWELRTAGAAFWLDKITSLPASFYLKSPPTTWNEMIDVTDDRVIAHVLRYHSTALEVCNLYPSGVLDEWGTSTGDTERLAASVTRSSLWQQAVEKASAYCGFAGSDSLGNLWLRRHPPLMDAYSATDRDDVETVIALTQGDTLFEPGINVNNETAQRAGEVEMGGFSFSGTLLTALRGRAPGKTPSQSPAREQAPGQILSSNLTTAALQLKDRAGHWLAYVNNPNADQSVELIGNLDILEPAWREWIALTASEDNPRGLALSATRFVVKRVSVRHSNDPAQPPKVITWTADQETLGLPGDIIQIEACTTLPDTPWVPPEIIYPKDDWGTPADPVAGSPDLVYSGDQGTNGIWRSRDYTDSATRSWDLIADIVTLAGAGYTLRAGCPGHNNPKNRIQIVVADGTYVKIYETTDLDAAAPSWTLLKTITSACYRASLSNPPPYAAMIDTWVLTLQRTDEYTSTYRTHDNWTTSEDNVDLANGFGAPNAAAVSPVSQTQGVGKVIVADYHASGNHNFKVSSDYADTFPSTVGSAAGYYNPVGAVYPWLNNGGELIWYTWGGSDSGTDAYLKKTINGGSTLTDITPTYGGTKYGGGHRNALIHDELHLFTPNPLIMFFIAQPSVDKTGGNQRLFGSIDGATWPDSPYEFAGFTAHTLGGWPPDDQVLFIPCSDRLLYTIDGGVTMERTEYTGYANGVFIHVVELS